MLLYKLIQQMRGPILTCHTAAAKLIRLYCKKTEDFMPELPALMSHLMDDSPPTIFTLSKLNVQGNQAIEPLQAIFIILPTWINWLDNIPLQQGRRAELKSQWEPFWVILQPPALSLWKKDHSTISTFMKGLAPHLVQLTLQLHFTQGHQSQLSLPEQPQLKGEEICLSLALSSALIAAARQHQAQFGLSQIQLFCSRIPRYVMLLTDLDKNTPNYHIDKDNLSEALEKVKGVASLINNKKEAKYFNILISLYNQLEPKVEEKLNQRLRLVEKINIDNYTQINRQLFQLQLGANTYSFKVKTKEEKKEWLGDIQKYIQDSQMKVISFQQSLKNIDKVPNTPNAELLSKLQLSPRGYRRRDATQSMPPTRVSLHYVRSKTGSFRHSMDSTFFGLPPLISDKHHLTTLGLHCSVTMEEPPAPTKVKETKNNSRSNYTAINHTMASTVIPTAFLQAGSVAPILKPVKQSEGQVQKSPSQPEDEKTERKVVTHKTTTQEGSSAVQRTVTVTPPSLNWTERTSLEPEATLSPSNRRKRFRASMALHRGAKPEQ
ncbi:hypothetical protein PROFUN_16298 [Planoprotostelium fungivorum]|uniref:PH domain-containing protein n=1 Tax=Planoprotostelium fungivorum TaxID=1890364 RepID=A0A2P6MQL6_9EUKA|nr:hypothetical protein PROFUN_16298 [Planoprotostelium fungivorum]